MAHFLAGLIAWIALVAAPAMAQGVEVDLELVLAVDVSASIDASEARQQRDGYLYALRHPEVVAAIRDGPLGRIALIYVEWAGVGHQRTVVDWTVVDGRASADAFAETLAAAAISTAPSTSISAVIDFCRREFRANGFAGQRRVIDVSGDGPNSDGRRIRGARDDAVREGITINGLPILSLGPNPGGFAPSSHVDWHYANMMIGGPGAFVLPAQEFGALGAAVVRKLVREITGEIPVAVLSGR